ncbi:hypothetical protein [Microbulbifer sp. JMSA003]|uniref:hypothetical protein n=1 Tax=Microbulbifer sp. JMSA003 TaxID=3243369 RepID=UPI00403923CA
MSTDWILIFQGMASFSAMIQAAKAGLDITGITKDELAEKVRSAESNARAVYEASAENRKFASSLSESEIELINKKLDEAKERWYEAISHSDDQADWAEATDRSRSDQCALLKIAKQLHRGILPKEWYKLWVDLGCC